MVKSPDLYLPTVSSYSTLPLLHPVLALATPTYLKYLEYLLRQLHMFQPRNEDA